MNNTDSKPIICGTDFSEKAGRAADVAAALAMRLSAPLLLVHSRGSLIHALTPDIDDALVTTIRDRLHGEAERLRRLGATVEETLSAGTPDELLTQLARKHAARLLVVSSLGRSAPARWLLGSVAERTAESAPVPTLVVRDAAPFEAWARGERALKVFVGTDFTVSADAALRWVAELQKLGPCEVTAGYADWTPEEASRLGVQGAMGLVGNPLAVQRILERDVKAKVTSVLGEENVRVVVQGGWGRTDAQLVGMAAEAQADIIVVGTHQRSGFSRLGEVSVSRGLLHRAPMSVVCVPASVAERMAVPRVHEIRRVLVAVDLNEKYGFAAPYGYGICEPGGTVRLVHVVPFRLPNPMIGGYGQDFPTEKEHFDQVAQSEARLRALAPLEAEARGITTEVEVIDSREIAQAICANAERFNADAICIGSHTRPGFGAKVLGSVSLAVLHQSRRPVLVVWPPME